jgi:peptide/nickel transport system substrate-binding protein
VDEILNAAAVELDPDKRKALYAEFQQIVATDLPVYTINALPYHTAYNSKLKNVPTGIWGTMHPMDMVEWGE